MHYIAWMDFETTGTDELQDEIIEIGCVITDEYLHEMGEFHQLIQPTRRALQAMDKVVVDMHTASGLLRELANHPWPLTSDLADVGSEWYHWLQKWTSVETPKLTIAGHGVSHMELRFIQRQFPDYFMELFNYYSYDISVFRRLLQTVVPEIVVPKPENMPHRSLPDARIALQEWRTYRSWFEVVKEYAGPMEI